MSKGEGKIINILNQSRYRYEREYTFADLRGGRYRFDFYLPQLKVAIEFDGAQHFVYTPKFHKTRGAFMAAQERDREKNSYCLANNIALYRIPYWELDHLISLTDLIQDKFLVRSRWHNDLLVKPNHRP